MLVFAALVLAVVPATAGASLKVSAWTSHERLTVSRDGSAQITWRESGRKRVALIRGDGVIYRGRIGRHDVGRHVSQPSPTASTRSCSRTARTTPCSASAASASSAGGARPSCASPAGTARKPRLALTGEWAYNGRLPRVCGTATYHGRPFFGGRHTLSGRPLDAFGRNVYIDVLRRRRLVPHHGRPHPPAGLRPPDPRRRLARTRSTARWSPART